MKRANSVALLIAIMLAAWNVALSKWWWAAADVVLCAIFIYLLSRES